MIKLLNFSKICQTTIKRVSNNCHWS